MKGVALDPLPTPLLAPLFTLVVAGMCPTPVPVGELLAGGVAGAVGELLGCELLGGVAGGEDNCFTTLYIVTGRIFTNSPAAVQRMADIIVSRFLAEKPPEKI